MGVIAARQLEGLLLCKNTSKLLRLGVRLRRTGCHGKVRRKNSVNSDAIFSFVPSHEKVQVCPGHPTAVSYHFSPPDHSIRDIELIGQTGTVSVRPAKDFF